MTTYQFSYAVQQTAMECLIFQINRRRFTKIKIGYFNGKSSRQNRKKGNCIKTYASVCKFFKGSYVHIQWFMYSPIFRLHIFGHTKYYGSNCEKYENDGHYNHRQLWLFFHIINIDGDNFGEHGHLIFDENENGVRLHVAKIMYNRKFACFGWEPYTIACLIAGGIVGASDNLRTIFEWGRTSTFHL